MSTITQRANPVFMQLSASDQKQVKALVLEVSKEYGFTYNSKYHYDLDDPKKYYIESGGMFYVLKLKRQVIGTIGIASNGDVAEIRRFYVKKEHQGKGLGSFLLDKAIEYCVNKKYKKIEVWTNKQFKVAHILYQKRGFLLTNENVRAYYMEKII